MSFITASCDTLLSQAKEVASEYLSAAVSHIDAEFGEGYAKANPELVAAFMKVAGNDFNASITAKMAGECAEEIVDALQSISSSISEIATSLDK